VKREPLARPYLEEYILTAHKIETMTKKIHSIRIKKENLIYENSYGKLYDDDVIFLPQSVNGKYVRWTWKAPYSVAVLPMVDENQALLIKNFRHSARKVLLEVPKGFGAIGEEPLSVAKKELEEETGLRSEKIEQLGTVVTDPSFAYHPMHLFIAYDCASSKSHHESSEVIVETFKININDVPQLLSKKGIEDAVTLLLLWLASHL